MRSAYVPNCARTNKNMGRRTAPTQVLKNIYFIKKYMQQNMFTLRGFALSGGAGPDPNLDTCVLLHVCGSRNDSWG